MKVAEKLGAFHLGVEKQVHIPPRTLHFDEVGDDLVQQTLALMGAADGEAPQGAAEAAAGADDVVFLVEHGADVLPMPLAMVMILAIKLNSYSPKYAFLTDSSLIRSDALPDRTILPVSRT